jgi:voltage-gated potassium channel
MDASNARPRSLRDYRRPGALEAFERRTAWPMMGVVVASLVALLIPLFAHLSAAATTALVVADWALWLVFVAEYWTRWYLAMDRRHFVSHNLIDLAVVVLPMFPAVRAIRLARLLRLGVMGARVVDQSEAIVKRSNTKYAIALALLVVLLAAVMVWSVEHDNPTSSIHSMSDALWWAVTTVTTVGYGDKYPSSVEGKAVAVTLMLLGIAVFGLISATLASLFVESDTREEYEEVLERLDRLEAKIDSLTDSASSETRSPTE